MATAKTQEQNKPKRKKLTGLDYGFLALIILLGLTSFFAIYNSFNLIKGGSGSSYLTRQAMWYSLGFIVIIAMHTQGNDLIFKYVNKFYRFLVLVLIYLFLSRILNLVSGGRFYLPLASPINGAISWISTPLGSFQPSEFIKITFIVQVSFIISNYQKKNPDPSWQDDFHMLMKIVRLIIFPMILIFLQPDTGLCMIIAFTLLILIMVSGIRKEFIWIVLGLIVLVFGVFFYLYFYKPDILSKFIQSYRLQRIESWLHPESYIRGSSNQLYTSLLSLGSAGLTGYGLQANIIAIPEAHTDFIFAAFGQCFGLMGTTFVLSLCFVFDIYLCSMATRVSGRSNKFIIIGTIAMLLYQQVQNMGMIVGLLPITGITLPLISYGGSSTLSYFLLFGLILNMPEKQKKKRQKKTAHTSSLNTETSAS